MEELEGPRRSLRPISKWGLGRELGPREGRRICVPFVLNCSVLSWCGRLFECRRELRPWAEELKPVVDMHICTVALDIRSKASRHASAGGHFSMRSPSTEVAARMVKSTSSIV
jgi:hypothetical protein